MDRRGYPVDAQTADFAPVRFSTDDLPERDRIPAWREFFGRSVFRTEIEPDPDTRFHADVTVRNLPGLFLVSSVFSPARLSRTPALLADGNDDVSLFVSTSNGTTAQRGREIVFSAGDAVVLSAAEASASTSPHTARFRCVHVRRAELRPLVRDLDDAMLRRVAPDTEALRYLLSYVAFFEDQQASADPTLARIAAAHLRDLFALTLGATRDATVVAEDRGLRAARLQAVKRYIRDNLGHRDLSIEIVAARHCLSPRNVQRLFESEGTTFSEYVLNQRLELVHRGLADPTHADWTVGGIALEAGFRNVSYFNRRFRLRFGVSPSDVRAEALRKA